MKHTPGPWDVREFRVFAVKNDRTVASCGQYFNNQDEGANYDENCANARLIAAAPELLAACEQLIRAEIAPRQISIEGVTAALESARSAVKKALEGK